MEQINTDDINSANNNPNIIFKKRWKINDKLKIKTQKVLSRFMKMLENEHVLLVVKVTFILCNTTLWEQIIDLQQQ